MVSPTEGWAVGGVFYRLPLNFATASQSVEMNVLLHETNETWTSVRIPTERALRSVSMSSADEGAIVGWNTFLRYSQGEGSEVQTVP